MWGVIPEEACHDDRLELDARGNNLQGRPPSCAWESARRGSAVLLSRNRLSGEMHPLGDVRTIHAGFNALEGDVGDVLGKAVKSGLVQLVVNHNKFTSKDGLARLGASNKLEILDVSWNELGPAGSANLADHLASYPALTRYDIGGNTWDHARIAKSVIGERDSSDTSRAYVALHAQVTLPSPTALTDMCGHCPKFDSEIGESKAAARVAVHKCIETNGCEGYDMFAEDDSSVTSYAPRILDALACSIRAALEPRLVSRVASHRDRAVRDANEAGDYEFVPPTFARTIGELSNWRVDVVEGALQPEVVGDGFTFGYTLTPSKTAKANDEDKHVFAERIKHALSTLQSQSDTALAVAAEQCSGMHYLTHGMYGRVKSSAIKTRDHLRNALVDVRGACPIGRMGLKCDYVCANSWRRTASHVGQRGGF